MPIIEYLDETILEKPLLPKDPIKKAKIRAFCEVINAGTQPVSNLRVAKKVVEDFNGNKIEWIKFWVEKGLNG